MKWYESKFFINVFYLTLCMKWELSVAIRIPFAAQAHRFLYLSSSREVSCSSYYSGRPNFRSDTDLEQIGALFSAFHMHFLKKVLQLWELFFSYSYAVYFTLHVPC